VLAGTAAAPEAGRAYADFAEVCIAGLAQAALAEVTRQGGDFPGETAVVALGKCGSRELTASSDLDLMTLYLPETGDAVSSEKGWAAETFYGRFTSRLITALSAPTAEGTLYEVDMRLRPSGNKGPVAVSLAAFDAYYAEAAETWEYLALTRARVVWATSEAFAVRIADAIEAKLRVPRDARRTADDVLAMRELVAAEKPAAGFWDLKLNEGGLVDIEFAAQFLQLAHAAAGGPLRQNTAEALETLRARDLGGAEAMTDLATAWRLQQDLSQVIRLALADDAEPETQPKALRALLARAAGLRDYRSLPALLERRRAAAHRAFLQLLSRA
jgi:glutamate-ammonia-ligase adenylyltransferase